MVYAKYTTEKAFDLMASHGINRIYTDVYAIYLLRPDSQTFDPLRSGSAYPVSKPVRFKLACCVDRVDVQARATCSHGDRYDAALTETLTLGYSENWRVTIDHFGS